MKNWWYYHKWYVICGVILFAAACSLIGNALGLWTKKPDFQIAYVGKMQLPQDTVNALERAFASLGSGFDYDFDFNQDGEVIIRVNQYINGSKSAETEVLQYEYASEISLIGDISDCDSYFFLTDNPDNLQRRFQILAAPDGSCPDERDYSTGDKVILWSDCPLLSEMELGSYSTFILGEEQTGSSQELLSGLYLGRRCFYTDALSDNYEQCSELWNALANASEHSH